MDQWATIFVVGLSRLANSAVSESGDGTSPSEPNIVRPLVHWVSNPTLANETVVVAGSGFSNTTSVTLYRDPGGTVALPFDVDSVAWANSVKFVLPAAATPPCFARLSPSPGASSGYIVVPVNAPDIWWTSGSYLPMTDPDSSRVAPSITPVVFPMGTLRVFGRSLGWSEDGLTCITAAADPAPNPATHITFLPNDGSPLVVVPAAGATCYEASFEVPYQVGGLVNATISTQWGNSTRFQVIVEHPPAPAPLPPTYIDVMNECHGDIYLAMRKAAAVPNGAEAIVELGPHVYELTEPLVIPQDATVQGVTHERSVLSFVLPPPADAADPVHAAITCSRGVTLQQFSVSLTVTGPAVPLRNSTTRPGTVAVRFPPEASAVVTRNLHVEVDGNASNALRIESTSFDVDNCTLWQKNCTLVDGFETATTLYMAGASDGVVSNTSIRWRCSAYDLDTSERVIFESNTIECNVTGAVPHGNSISGYGGRTGLPMNRWWAIFRNRFTRPACGPHAPGQCGGTNWVQRETLTTDAGYGWAVGYVESQGHAIVMGEAEPTVRMRWAAWTTAPRPGTSLVILNGTGLGTTRLVVAALDNQTLVINAPFNSAHVSETSFVAVVSTYSQKIIAGNTFSWTEVIQFFGVTLQGVIANNQLIDANVNHTLHTRDPTALRFGGSMRAVGECYHGPAPVFHIEYVDNSFVRSDGIFLQDNHGPAYFECGGKDGFLGPWIRWAVMRRNKFSGISLAAKAVSSIPPCAAITLADAELGSGLQSDEFSSDIVLEHNAFQCQGGTPGGYAVNRTLCDHCEIRV